jgi:hypothetical protein
MQLQSDVGIAESTSFAAIAWQIRSRRWRISREDGGLMVATNHHVQAPRPAPAAAGRLYMTGDLRALTGLPRTHMDFYLREGIIQPTLRTESGYLLFDEAELETLRAILRWRDEGVGIREIRDRLGRPADS